ncbi:hypothetical protein [Pseudonocardia sp. ICBG1293]|uniref:hypothetical protein n=1 Tax=Pseudonocardia sp. ICBG1293 TaxID=2844382 RepID=UPI001CCF3900|nr:hypothetical protein [Pseudonocardia sp. ICBG1293]
MSAPSATLPARRAVALVARREFRVQVHKRSFWVSNAIMLLVIAGGLVAYSLFGTGDERTSVGVAADPALAAAVGTAGERLGVPLEVRAVASADAARAAVTAGDLDVALLGDGTGPGATAVVTSELAPATRAVLDAAVADRATAAGLAAVGVTPAELAAATRPPGWPWTRSTPPTRRPGSVRRSRSSC